MAANPRRQVNVEDPPEDRYAGPSGHFSGLPVDEMMEDEPARKLQTTKRFTPTKSIEGWILIVGSVHEEAQEEHIYEAFDRYGEIQNLNLNLDRRTGYVKGYAFVEYSEKKNAEAAVEGMNGKPILGKAVFVDWAFMKPPKPESQR